MMPMVKEVMRACRSLFFVLAFRFVFTFGVRFCVPVRRSGSAFRFWVRSGLPFWVRGSERRTWKVPNPEPRTENPEPNVEGEHEPRSLNRGPRTTDFTIIFDSPRASV